MNTVSSLETLRIRAGRNTRKGKILSNVIEQRPWLHDDTGDRSWVVHPTQDIRFWINWQAELLAR